jgi:hypothetical protein
MTSKVRLSQATCYAAVIESLNFNRDFGAVFSLSSHEADSLKYPWSLDCDWTDAHCQAFVSVSS